MKTLVQFLAGMVVMVMLNISCQNPESKIQIITPEEYSRLEQLGDVQLIDVRSVESFQELHIKGAQNLVFDSEFSSNLNQLDKTKPVAVYCKTGGLSKRCVEILKDSGFVKLYDLKGGLAKWQYSGIALDSLPTLELEK